MHATEESPVVHRLEVEIGAARVRQASDRAYRQLAKQVKLPGFRPGKAPRSVLEKLYGAQVAEQLEHTLVAETLADALAQSGLEPVTQPTVDAEPPAEGRGFRYTARVEVRPALVLPDVNGLPARRPRVEVGDTDVERELEMLRQRQAALIEEAQGTTVRGDHVLTIDFVGRMEGKPFEGGSGRGVEFALGSGQFLPEFDEQLVGARAGDDRQVRVRFPDDYGNREVAGKEAQFLVRVVEVKRREVPALDDEFAKDLGDFETLDELRDRVRADLAALRGRAAEAELRRTLMDALIERTPFEVPPGLVDRELDRQLAAARQRLEGSVSEDALHAQLDRWREDWRDRAEREVRETLLLEAVAREQQFDAEPAEVEARVREVAGEQGVDPVRLRKAWGEENLVAAIRAQIVDRKALDFLVAAAKVEETTDS